MRVLIFTEQNARAAEHELLAKTSENEHEIHDNLYLKTMNGAKMWD